MRKGSGPLKVRTEKKGHSGQHTEYSLNVQTHFLSHSHPTDDMIVTVHGSLLYPLKPPNRCLTDLSDLNQENETSNLLKSAVHSPISCCHVDGYKP